MKTFLLSVLCIAAPLLSLAENVKPLPDSVTHKIDSAINTVMKTRHITGASVAVVDAGKLAFIKGYGYASRRKNIQASASTVYGIGSITKTFTAMAILKLRNEGRIDLEKPASYYLKDLTIKSTVENGDILKIKNMLTHTSGLTDGILNNDACSNEVDYSSVIADLNKTVLVHKARWKMSYSNVGYVLLGIIVERVSGMKYEQYIRENFLDKMEMTHSGFYNHPEDTLFSRGYGKDTAEVAEPVLRDLPAGRLFCSAEDMSHFMEMLLNYGTYKGVEILPRKTIEEMETSHMDGLTLDEGPHYGIGLFIEPMNYKEDSMVGPAIGHGGDTWVFHSTCFVFPKIGVGIVILSNSTGGYSFVSSSLHNLLPIWMKSVRGTPVHKKDPLKDFKCPCLTPGLSTREIAGVYCSGEKVTTLVRRINDRKVEYQQDNTHIILTRRADGSYDPSLKLLFVFRKKIPDIALTFEKIDGNIYLKQTSLKSGNGNYELVKDNPIPLSDNWKKAAGKYRLLNSCSGNGQGLPQEITVKGNKIYLKMKFDKDYEYYSFNAIDDTTAAIDGIDRYSGMVMKLEGDGKVYFSGYEMVKE